MKKRFYFTDIKDFAQWYKDKNKINMTIEAMLEEPFLSRLHVRMEEENIRRKQGHQKHAETFKLNLEKAKGKRTNYNCSDAQRQKMSDAKKGKSNWSKGIAKSEDQKRKISETLKNSDKSPNKVYVKCSDGFYTTKPSAGKYCNNRNLDIKDCIIVDNFYEMMSELIYNTLPNDWFSLSNTKHLLNELKISIALYRDFICEDNIKYESKVLNKRGDKIFKKIQ